MTVSRFKVISIALMVIVQSYSVTEGCEPGKLSCPNRSKCIPVTWICDSGNDCDDNSDEAYCSDSRPITCPDHTFQCSNHVCIPRANFCDGRNQCGDRSDEFYCNLEIVTPCPRNWIRCTDGRRCIQKNWKCDRINDCLDGSDESSCGDSLFPLSIRNDLPDVTSARSKGTRWFLSRRKSDSSTIKWGPQLYRIATALYLSNSNFFAPGNKTGEDIGSELMIQLLSKLNGNITLRNEELALYIQALTVTCNDPRTFFGHNLVSELRRRVEASNYTNPFEILTLCNAKDNMTDRDIERVTTVFDSPHRPFWTDTQAIATMALQCLSSAPNLRVDERLVKDMQIELKKHQFRNGTVDNPTTTALVLQALMSNNSYVEFFDFKAALTALVENQRISGSWGSIRNSYYALPVLSFKSLLNISSDHCIKYHESEEEVLQKLQSDGGDKFVVQYSVWIGDDVDLGRTWRIRLETGKDNSFYDVIEIIKKLDSRHNVTYNVIDNKPYVSSLFGKEDDPELGVYWFTYVRSLQPQEAPKRIEKSPVDMKVLPKQELILWYKPGRWSNSDGSENEEA